MRRGSSRARKPGEEPELTTPERLAVDPEGTHPGSAETVWSFDHPREAQHPLVEVVERNGSFPCLPVGFSVSGKHLCRARRARWSPSNGQVSAISRSAFAVAGAAASNFAWAAANASAPPARNQTHGPLLDDAADDIDFARDLPDQVLP